MGMKESEKVEFGEDQVWVELEARRVEPRGMVAERDGLVENKER